MSKEKEREYSINDLRWVRLFSPVHIPCYLVEQVKNRDFSVSDFFKYQEINCMVDGKHGLTVNPFNHLYGLVSEGNQVEGFLWCVIDPLSKHLVINTYSVDSKYWKGGQAVKRLDIHIKSIMKKMKIPKVYWITSYPKHSEKYGFKRSKNILMEYEQEKEDGKDNDGRNNERGQCIDVGSGTKEALPTDTDTAGTTVS